MTILFLTPTSAAKYHQLTFLRGNFGLNLMSVNLTGEWVLSLKRWHHPPALICWATAHAKNHAFDCKFFLGLKSSFLQKRHGEDCLEEKQEVQQTAFVWASTTRPVIYTLIGEAIATWGISALRGKERRERERERAPSWKRELLSAAVVRDKAESSQTPCMINDLRPRCVEAW